ncbi:uncharacterized protein BDR25DRAFT_290857 [Lindgomyces ingoldianus]|uniref:Uncharacterized protein n=1 Tax=Lindgomyces ingoldianus TaxID=673940 RepID=A0ACB6QMD9_9PLEO|nr:uncharacterized protein BDR25DRAFT_290857 [Lindgomyces ingoldianus]KAF2468184.1 hypothetical protein BDR25DRAFT_290857 [Lindgomyces ingoldianus]
MGDFLTPISTTTVKRPKEPESWNSRSPHSCSTAIEVPTLESPEEAYKLLKDQPSLDAVGQILRYFAVESSKRAGFSLITPGPLQAQIVDTLVTTTIPDYWRIFKDNNRNLKQLVKCLQNPSGLGAILNRFRHLIDDCRKRKPVDQTRDASVHIEDLLDALGEILNGDRTSSQIWDDIQAHAQNPIQKRLMWREYVAQTTSGRLLSTAAQAEDILKERGISRKESWLANGKEYASWLGRTMVTLMRDNIALDESVSAVVDICGKALTLGYTDRVIASIVLSMVNSESSMILKEFLPKMRAHEQRQYLNSAISFLAKHYLASIIDSREDSPLKPSPAISAAAAIVHELIKGNEALEDHTVLLLTSSALPVLDDSLAARRSVIAALAQNEEKLQNALEKSLKLFGDTFYIKHTPVLQQEALAQTLAISCGYVQRSVPMFLTMTAKSSYHVAGMSNRIGASSPRARYLGMAVGTAISRIVDKPELQLKFDLEGNEAVEAKWYQRLTQVDDRIGSIKDLKARELMSAPREKSPDQRKYLSSTEGTVKASDKPTITEINGPRIVEILSDPEDEDDDLIPYAKPDSDPEDDGDDPEMLDRKKLTAPAYIRDLMAGLRDQENYDRHQLALSTAASLIRRKTNFGSEVTDHVEELASVMTGLNDTFDFPEFNEERQRALIAILLAKPGPMAQWFARSFFSGDYSLSQRIAILTTLGLSARELAGRKDSSTEDLVPATPSFPSKTLPPHLHNIYALDSDPVAQITEGLAKQILSPIAASAADHLTGPNILKVRTFSSRMEVEKRRKKPIPNALAQIVADNFFFPLTGRWWMNTHSSQAHRSDLYTSPHLLPPYLHTLAILMNTAGPNTLALPQMTREFWELLLSVRGFALGDKTVLGALLFAFLMLLETNENKERLATEQAKELVETQEWVRQVFEGLGAGSEEDEKVRVLAAGVVIRCQEVVDKYQRRMVGSMMNY